MTQSSFLALFNSPAGSLALLAIIAWSLVWKGFALWKAARNGQRNWFVAMLALNTVGVLEIVYLFYFSNKKTQLPLSPQNPQR